MGNALETEFSDQDGRPVELYHFTSGTTNYRYTSAEGDYVFGGFTWLARPLGRNSIGKSGEVEQTNLEVSLPTTDVLASLYIGIQPAARTDLVVRRVHIDASPTTSITLFNGFVTSAKFKDEKCTFQLKPFNELFHREMPRYTYQGLCNHVLYSGQCGILEAASPNQLVATVNGIQNSGEIITVTGAGSVVDNVSPAQPFKGGMARLVDFSDYRLILDQDGDDLTLLLPFRDSVLGGQIVLQRGCDRTVDTCRTKFNNVINYGGFPHVPGKNPFGQSTYVEPATEEEPPPSFLGKFFSGGGG